MSEITRRSFFQAAGIAAAVPVFGGVAVQAQQADSDVKVESDVVYGKGGDMDLHLDIYRPAGIEKRMAVIHIHGGGFTAGSKTGVASSSRAFARQGYVSIASQYRLAGQERRRQHEGCGVRGVLSGHIRQSRPLARRRRPGCDIERRGCQPHFGKLRPDHIPSWCRRHDHPA